MELRIGDAFQMTAEESVMFIAPIPMEEGDSVWLNLEASPWSPDRIMQVTRGRMILYKNPFFTKIKL